VSKSGPSFVTRPLARSAFPDARNGDVYEELYEHVLLENRFIHLRVVIISRRQEGLYSKAFYLVRTELGDSFVGETFSISSFTLLTTE
jgi:hypothetical protein